MRIKNLKLVTLSIVAAFAVNNASYTAAGELSFWPNVMTSKPFSNEKIKSSKESKVEHPDSRNSTIKFGGFCPQEAKWKLEKQALDFNHMFGLFLQFGREEICIKKLQKEMSDKIVLVKRLKTEMDKSPKCLKEVAEVLASWEYMEKELVKEMKDLDEKKVEIKKLRENYRRIGMSWFSDSYGTADKKKGNCADQSTCTERKYSKNTEPKASILAKEACVDTGSELTCTAATQEMEKEFIKDLENKRKKMNEILNR